MLTRVLKEKILPRTVFMLLIATCLFTSVAAQSGGLKGHIRTNSGDNIRNASVTIRKDGKDIKSVSANTKGRFLIEGIDPGSYSLIVDAKGFSSGAISNVEVKKDKVRDLGDRLILNVDQGTQVILKGSVFFREGTSVTGAKVEFERIDADGSVKRLGSTYSSVSGEFTLRQPDGAAKFRVKASYKGVTGTKDIQVENAAVYRIAITLELSRVDK